MQKQVFYETKEKSGTNINQSISGDKKSLWSFLSRNKHSEANRRNARTITKRQNFLQQASANNLKNNHYNRDVIKNGVQFFIRFHIDFLFLFLTRGSLTEKIFLIVAILFIIYT